MQIPNPNNYNWKRILLIAILALLCVVLIWIQISNNSVSKIEKEFAQKYFKEKYNSLENERKQSELTIGKLEERLKQAEIENVDLKKKRIIVRKQTAKKLNEINTIDDIAMLRYTDSLLRARGIR